MKNENLEKYIGELSPELQEKARACKDMAELNALLAENDVELSEDALESVAGGCTSSSCDHDFIPTERIGMLPYAGTNNPKIMYNGKTVTALVTKVCSKCSETHYYIEPSIIELYQRGVKVMNVILMEISQSDYNTLKAQKTW